MTEPAIPPPSRLSWLLVAFAVLVLVGLGAAYWWVGQSAPAEPDEAEEPGAPVMPDEAHSTP